MKRHILLVSTGIIHPSISARKRLRNLLEERCSMTEVSSIEDAQILRRGGFDAAVVYLHRQNISDEALSSFEAFVAHGGGLLGIHSATASFKQSDRWLKLMGGRFISHEEVVQFESVNTSSSIFSPLAFKVRDELYIHKTLPDINIHYKTSKNIPTVWTHSYGKGRVCYIEPGHVASSLDVPEVRIIIMEGLDWICGG